MGSGAQRGLGYNAVKSFLNFQRKIDEENSLLIDIVCELSVSLK